MKLQPKEILEGQRIFLKRFEVSFDYAHKMYGVIDANREHISPWLDWGLKTVTKNVESTYAFILNADKQWQEGECFEYSILDKETNEILGAAGVHIRGKSADMHFEIGFWLSKQSEGKGYMQEAVKLLETEFFAQGVERLMIRNATENVRSKNVGTKLGYQFEGTQRHAMYSKYVGGFVDVNVYAKLASD